MSRVAIVAALDREVRPLVKDWSATEREHAGRKFRFHEKGDVHVVCGGVGAEAARRAAEAAIQLFGVSVVYSAGFAGALTGSLRVGDVLRPRRVINAGDGSSVALESGEGTLVSVEAVATPEQKRRLREAFGADAVDMEAAAVARAADARGVAFAIIKVISDEVDFEFPAMDRFVDSAGQFSEAKFAWFAALRPWLWPKVAQIARHSQRASRVLCASLCDLIESSTGGALSAPEAVHRD